MEILALGLALLGPNVLEPEICYFKNEAGVVLVVVVSLFLTSLQIKL